MEETIRYTFLDLKVDIISTTLALLGCNIATCFTVVDTALAQMASSPHASVGPDGPPLRETPPTQAAVPDPSRMDTAIPGLARPTSADKAPHPGCFQAETTFQPGSAFPASNQFSHMKDGGPPHADSNHRQQMADDSDDAGVWTAWRPDSAIPANRFQHYRDMGVPHEQAHHQPQGDDEDGTAPYPVGHSQRSAYSCSLGLLDTSTEAHRGHCWSLNDQEVDNDKVSYASMGGPIKSPSP